MSESSRSESGPSSNGKQNILWIGVGLLALVLIVGWLLSNDRRFPAQESMAAGSERNPQNERRFQKAGIHSELKRKPDGSIPGFPGGSSASIHPAQNTDSDRSLISRTDSQGTRFPTRPIFSSEDRDGLFSSRQEISSNNFSQLEFKRKVEDHLKGKLDMLLDNVLGPGRHLCVVTAEVSRIDQEIRHVEHEGPGYVVERETVVEDAFRSPTTDPMGRPSPKRVVRRSVFDQTTTRERKYDSRIDFINVTAVVDLPEDEQGLPRITGIEIEGLIKSCMGFDPVRGDQVLLEFGKLGPPAHADSNTYGLHRIGTSGSLGERPDPAQRLATWADPWLMVPVGFGLLFCLLVLGYRKRTDSMPTWPHERRENPAADRRVTERRAADQGPVPGSAVSEPDPACSVPDPDPASLSELLGQWAGTGSDTLSSRMTTSDNDDQEKAA